MGIEMNLGAWLEFEGGGATYDFYEAIDIRLLEAEKAVKGQR